MKVALITGAASGIGKELTLIHLEKGHFVVMVDKDTEKLKHEFQQLSVAFPNQLLPVTCDITHPEDICKLVQEIKNQKLTIYWLYNNAGIIGTIAPLWELSSQQVENVLNVNVMGMVHMIQGFLPLLFEQPITSHLINIASMYALCSGSQLAPYSMSKHAVLALSESLYFDLKRLEKPVSVSVAFPSFTDTALIANTPAEMNHSFHESLKSLLTHSRPAKEVAEYIVQEVEKNQFYILPDKEVKSYCEERARSIVLQETPHQHNIEKLMHSLTKRKKKKLQSS